MLRSLGVNSAESRNLSMYLTSGGSSARPPFCHSERSEAKSRNLLILLTFPTPSAHGETSIAARNRRVRQNMFPQIRVAEVR